MNENETPAEKAIRIKAEIEAERAAQAAKAKSRMGLQDTLRITGKTRPEHVGMGKRLVIWERED